MRVENETEKITLFPHRGVDISPEMLSSLRTVLAQTSNTFPRVTIRYAFCDNDVVSLVRIAIEEAALTNEAWNKVPLTLPSFTDVYALSLSPGSPSRDGATVKAGF